METIRAFVAIGLGDDVHRYLGETGDELAGWLPERSVRWVKPSSIHLTLSFLGNLEIERIPDVVQAMDRVAAQSVPFDLKLDKLGCFPNPQHPRVIWIGIVDEGNQLAAIQRNVQNELSKLGWKADRRPFHPHLTLGRVKDKRRVVEANLPWGRPASPILIPVEAFHLFESQLQASGAVYSKRHTSKL